MAVFAAQTARALKKIKAKGEAVIWVKQNQVTPDANKPWRAEAPVGSPTTYPVSMVFLAPGGIAQQSSEHLMSGTSVPEGGQRALMHSVTFTPELNDIVLRGNDTLHLKGIDPVAPNGEVIIWKLRFA